MKDLLKILNKDNLEIEDIKYLLSLSGEDELNLLSQKSATVKQLYFGRLQNKILSIQFSNYCENNCLYCELREESTSVSRFRLTPDEVLEKINSIEENYLCKIILNNSTFGKFNYSPRRIEFTINTERYG